MAHIEGGCLCGQVRFSGEAEPLFQAVCHCKNCQRQAGSAYSVIVGVPRGALTVTGTLKTYHDRGDSGGTVDRHFCPDCGTSAPTAARRCSRTRRPGRSWCSSRPGRLTTPAG